MKSGNPAKARNARNHDDSFGAEWAAWNQAKDMPTVNDLIHDPAYLAYKFDFNTEKVSFLPISRNEIRRVNSLDRKVIDPDRPFYPVPLAKLVPLLNTSGQPSVENPPRFIFHTAFCSSTFLSRCLDVEGVTVSLREPQLLLDAANAKRLQWQSKSTNLGYRDMPGLALSLLQKHAGPSEKLIVKPINSVNNIIPELMQLTDPASSLMLYTDARNFLLSTLKKGEESKYAVRAMFDLIRCDFPNLAQLQVSDTIHMTDLKVIMTLWRLHIEQANQALGQFAPTNRLASVYGERLIENPLQALQTINGFLELGIPGEEIDRIAGSESRFEDAKNTGRAFSAEQREEAYRKVRDFYGEDLENGLQWMVRNNPGTLLMPEMSGALP